MSRTVRRNGILMSLCIGTAFVVLLLGFVPQKEGFEVRRRVNTATATLRPDDMPPPILEKSGSWAMRAAIRHDTVTAHTALPTGTGRWINFAEDGVHLLTFAGTHTLTLDAARHIFNEPIPLLGVLSPDYGERMVADSACVPVLAPTIAGERVLTAVSSQMFGTDLFDRARQYQGLVESFAHRFGLNPSLVYAIIHAESNFTPVLVSSRSAMGLMQLLPSTAGGEVHTFLHGRPANVSLAELSHPETNIRYGTAYLHLLLNRHLGEINDPLSREYCAVAAYNMGPNRFLRMYPPEVINAMTPDEVLERLTTSLPFSETRAFVAKVTRTRNEFATSF